jgi:hypothetical protein
MFNKTEDTACENCRYYFKEQCHRFPPSPTGNSWPVVMPKDWCGEFKLKFRQNKYHDPADNYKE